MKEQLFDEFVKEKLEHYDSGAPMQVWERIREKEKDERNLFFFFKRYGLMSIAILALTGIGYLTWNAVSTGNYYKQQNGSISQQTNKNRTIDPATTQLHSSGESNLQEKTKEEPAIVADKTTAVPTNSFNNRKDNSSTSDKETIADGSISANRTGNTITEKNKVNKSLISNRYNNRNTTFQHQYNTEINTGVNQPATSSFQTNEGKANVLNFTGLSSYRPFLKYFQPVHLMQSAYRPSCPTINGPVRNDLYLEIYGSPDYTMRTFSNPSTLNNYIDERRSVEDNRNGFSAGIRLAKNIGEKALIKAGINYSQINERLRIVSQNEKKQTQIITIRTVIRAPGDTLFIRDTTYFEQNGTNYRTTYNRYRFIDIPLIFSYEFGNPGILAFSVNAGPVFNLTSFYRGEVLDTTFSPVKISTAKGNGANNWRSNIGVGIFASFAVYKRINERLQIFAEPYFRYNFKPVTQNRDFVNQRYSTSGMQLGIRYNLFGERQRY